MARALWPAFRKSRESRHLLALFLMASTAIPVFYVPALLWGRHTHLSMAEYWRWWVVHLWVEGFFEVFATVAIAFLFTRMGLLRVKTATASVLFSTVVFLFGGSSARSTTCISAAPRSACLRLAPRSAPWRSCRSS